MNVVARQAVAEGRRAGHFTALLKEGEVRPAIVVNEEDILAIVAALRNVMGVWCGTTIRATRGTPGCYRLPADQTSSTAVLVICAVSSDPD